MRSLHTGINGCLLVLPSGLALLIIFGWSTLSPGPFVQGTAEWWGAVLGTMFGSDGGVFTFVLLTALAVGLYLCVMGFRPRPRTNSK